MRKRFPKAMGSKVYLSTIQRHLKVFPLLAVLFWKAQSNEIRLEYFVSVCLCCLPTLIKSITKEEAILQLCGKKSHFGFRCQQHSFKSELINRKNTARINWLSWEANDCRKESTVRAANGKVKTLEIL